MLTGAEDPVAPILVGDLVAGEHGDHVEGLCGHRMRRVLGCSIIGKARPASVDD